jgi:hypothetical protein
MPSDAVSVTIEVIAKINDAKLAERIGVLGQGFHPAGRYIDCIVGGRGGRDWPLIEGADRD